MTAETIDMSAWTGRIDPESNSERWHQCIRPLDQAGSKGVALLGFASDAGVKRNQGRPGATQGPQAIRRALAPLAWHRQAPAFDAGDVVCRGDALEEAQQRLGERLAELLDAGHFPVALGGGHEIAFGSWQGLARHLEAQGSKHDRPPQIGIVNLDAHFDLRDPSHAHSSGTPFAQMYYDALADEAIAARPESRVALKRYRAGRVVVGGLLARSGLITTGQQDPARGLGRTQRGARSLAKFEQQFSRFERGIAAP